MEELKRYETYECNIGNIVYYVRHNRNALLNAVDIARSYHIEELYNFNTGLDERLVRSVFTKILTLNNEYSLLLDLIDSLHSPSSMERFINNAEKDENGQFIPKFKPIYTDSFRMSERYDENDNKEIDFNVLVLDSNTLEIFSKELTTTNAFEEEYDYVYGKYIYGEDNPYINHSTVTNIVKIITEKHPECLQKFKSNIQNCSLGDKIKLLEINDVLQRNGCMTNHDIGSNEYLLDLFLSSVSIVTSIKNGVYTLSLYDADKINERDDVIYNIHVTSARCSIIQNSSGILTESVFYNGGVYGYIGEDNDFVYCGYYTIYTDGIREMYKIDKAKYYANAVCWDDTDNVAKPHYKPEWGLIGTEIK